jgi:hypothetical protein
MKKYLVIYHLIKKFEYNNFVMGIGPTFHSFGT